MTTVNQIVLSKLNLSTATTAINLAIDEIGQKIKNYCNLADDENIPPGLNYTYANMVVELLSYSNTDTDAFNNKNDVSAIKMGDTSYTFDLTSKHKSIDNLIMNYESDLIKYRKIRR